VGDVVTELGLLHYAGVFLGTALLTLLLVPLALRIVVRRIASRSVAAVERDGTVPYFGGAALIVAFAVVVLGVATAAPDVEQLGQLVWLVMTGLLLVIVGLADDLRRIPIPLRLAAMTAAALAMWFAEVRIDVLPSTAADLLLTVLWIVGITSAFNLLDNIDGLSAGVAGIAAFSFFVIAASNGQYMVAALSAALSGCALGFMRHNYFPARVYMGDAGSNFFGFLLAVLAIKLRFPVEGPPSVAYLVPVLVLAVPIFDLVLVVLTRMGSRRSPFRAGRDHTSHRLVAAGLPVPAAVGLIYLAALSLGWLGLVVSRLDDAATAFLLAGLVLFLGLLAGTFLASTLPMTQPIVGLTPMGAVLKRGFDLALGIPLVILATPVILVFAIVSAVTTRAWPFFVQERIGRYGRTFRFWKIRTLPPNAPRYALKPQIGELRLSGFSRFLRARHLDELPQLYAVLFGRMSLVGPRPKMPDEFEPVAEDYGAMRTRVPQGCTCLWQVGVHTAGLPSDSPEYDFWYLRHWSMRLDLWILWRTALTLIGAGRDMSLDEIPVWLVGRRVDIQGLAEVNPVQAHLDRNVMSG
jgi:UDP-GlcNAc:undecaprenyl-phosphate GlcNAc-1-phosphate transferase